MWVINLCAKVFCSIQTVPSILKAMGPSRLSRVCIHVPYSFPALCFFSLSSCLSSLFPFRAPLFYLSHIFSFSHLAVVCGLGIKRQSIETISNKDAWKHHGDSVADCALQSLALIFIPSPLSWEGKQEPENLLQRKIWVWQQRGRVLLHFITLRRLFSHCPRRAVSGHGLWGLGFWHTPRSTAPVWSPLLLFPSLPLHRGQLCRGVWAQQILFFLSMVSIRKVSQRCFCVSRLIRKCSWVFTPSPFHTAMKRRKFLLASPARHFDINLHSNDSL